MTSVIMGNEMQDIAMRLQAVIDTAIDGIITINDHGIIETINQAAAKQFGYTSDQVVGNNIKTLMPEPYHSEHDGYLYNYVKTRQKKIIGTGREVVGKRSNGDLFPFRLAVSEVVLNDRVIFTGIIHDLTEVRQAEDALLELNEALEKKVIERTDELESTVNELLVTNKKVKEREAELKVALEKEKELNELKSRFVSMASHEFRTPLSTIMSSASLISKYIEEGHNEKRQKHVDRIKSCVVDLTGILNDFLSLSKIEEGKIEVGKEEIRIDEICDIVTDEVKGLVKEGQILKKIVDKSIIIYSDKRILKNILFNLLSNAIKYTPQDGHIECKVERKDEKVVFTIIDDGIGIPKEDQKFLFERFFRASNVENIQGTGLGLNIVTRYVTLLGGEISFESEEGKGTEFLVLIPIN